MQLENEFSVPAPVSEVWKTLLDVERIAPCMPGATVERVDGDEVAGRVRVKVGPVTASYAGTARFVTKDEAAHRFVLEGSGRETRGAGTASATVEVSMSEQDADTRVRVVTSLEVTGKQAQFGRGVMADIAAKLTDQFAACLAERVRGPASASDGATAAPAPAATQASAAEGTAGPQAAAAGESLDLVSTVAMPVLKRLGPVLGGVAFGLILGLLLGHRRRIVIMTAAAPGSYPPARTVL
ncbi:MAG TPA: SRPBCC family protein [Streptosporangiaceae bacterium]|nr:SRPBCC family protein [Streptosporangiaceae bacterium]